MKCEKEKKIRIYTGETFRNGASRSADHIKDKNDTNLLQVKKSVINKHRVEEHDGEDVDFKMKKVASFQNDALGRQCLESIFIRNTPEEQRINSKDEFLQPINIVMKATKNGKLRQEEEIFDPLDDARKEVIFNRIYEENIEKFFFETSNKTKIG